MTDAILFDSQFVVKAIDPDGKKFDRVSRIIAHSSSLQMSMSLDVATDIYPIADGQSLTIQIASTLNTAADAANPTDEGDAWRIDRVGGLADEFDYVMHGKIYKYDDMPAEDVTVYGSFGGLLMALTGSYRHLSNLAVGSNVYLLVR